MSKQTNNLNFLKKAFPSFFTKNMLRKLQNKLIDLNKLSNTNKHTDTISDTNTQHNKDNLNVNNIYKNILIITENEEIKDFKGILPVNSFFIYFDENTFITMNTDTPLFNSVKSIILGVNNITPLVECVEGCYFNEDTNYVIDRCQNNKDVGKDVLNEVLKGINISTPNFIESCQNNKDVGKDVLNELLKGINISTPNFIESCQNRNVALGKDTNISTPSLIDRCQNNKNIYNNTVKDSNISTPSLIDSCQNNNTPLSKDIYKSSDINTLNYIDSCQKAYLNIKNLYACINETRNSFQEEKIFWKRFEKTNQILISHYKQHIEPFIPLLESNNQYILANSLKTHFNTSYYTLLSNTFNTFYSKISFICTTPFDFFKTILTLKDSLSLTPLIIKKSIKAYLKPFIINTQRILIITLRNNTLYIKKSLKYLNNTQQILLTLNTLLDERLSINFIIEIYQSFLEKDTFILLIFKTLYLLTRNTYINNRGFNNYSIIGGVNDKDSMVEGVNNKDMIEGVNNSTNTLHPFNTHTNKQQGVSDTSIKQHPVNNTTNTLHPFYTHTHKQQGVNNNTDEQDPLLCKGILKLFKRFKYSKGKFIIENYLTLNYLLYKKYKCKEKYCLTHLLLFSYSFEMKKVERRNNRGVNEKDMSEGVNKNDILEGVNNTVGKREGVKYQDNEQHGVNNHTNEKHGVNNHTNEQHGVNNHTNGQQGVNNHTNEKQGVNNHTNGQQGVNNNDIQLGVNNHTNEKQGVNNKRYRNNKKDYNNIKKRVLNKLTCIYIDNIKGIIKKKIFCNKKVCYVLSWVLKDEGVNTESLKYRISILPLLSSYISYGVTEGVNDSKWDIKNIKGNDNIEGVNNEDSNANTPLSTCNSIHCINTPLSTCNSIHCINTSLTTTLHSYIKSNNNTRRIHLFVNKIIKTFFKRNTLLEVKRVLEKVNINYDCNSKIEEIIRILQYIKGCYDLEALIVTNENKIEINFNENLFEIKPLIEIILSNFTYKSKVGVIGSVLEGVSGVNDSSNGYRGVNDSSIFEGVTNLCDNQQGVSNTMNKQHPFSNTTNKQHPFSNTTNTYHPFNNSHSDNTGSIKYPLTENIFNKEDLKEFTDIQYTFYLLKESISTFNILCKKIEKYISINTSYSYFENKLEGVNNSSNTLHPINNSTDKQHPVNNSTTYQPVNNTSNKQHPINNTSNKQHPINDATYHPVNNTATYHPVNNTTT
ncbi:hypothetical protein CWI39_1287p0010, partial [Hamiltosporidium magnivora]